MCPCLLSLFLEILLTVKSQRFFLLLVVSVSDSIISYSHILIP